MTIYLLLEFPVSESAPLRTQQLAHKRWLDPLVSAHGGKVRMALQADQLHGFGLDLEPPIHYYRPHELDDAALVAEYTDLKWQSKDRQAEGKPWNWARTLEIMEEQMQIRKIPVPLVEYPGKGRPGGR